MSTLTRIAASSVVSHLAEQRGVHEAFQWLHLQQPQIMRWQQELVSIPAPLFEERARAEWLTERFRELGLDRVDIDPAGNAIGLYPATASVDGRPGGPRILLSAHLDTVFPPATNIQLLLEDQRLTAPGACDNGAGVVALLAVAAALRHAAIPLRRELMLAGNVGEEGEGDLRGIRYLYDHEGSEPVGAHVVLDGAGHELAVTGAVGSRRYLASIHGPGGHSWSDAGRPNPIVAMSQAIARLSDLQMDSASAIMPESRWNVGTIDGGTSVNSIPETASARFDMRSTDPEQLIRMEVELYRAFEDAVLAANAAESRATSSATAAKERLSRVNNKGVTSTKLRLAIAKIGDRPAGKLAPNAPILETLRAVDRHLGIRTEERIASTDANIPLSLGREALSLGAGGEGGGIHTSNEWYDARNRELGLRRILLLVLALTAATE